MKIDVFDTYVTHPDGKTMHFDVLLPEGRSSSEKAELYAMKWLEQIGIQSDGIKLNNCSYCHSEQSHPEIEASLTTQGYAILQMEGCPAPIY